MLFLSGVTNDRVEARLVAAGAGLLVQPNTGYLNRVDQYPAFAADNGCFSTKRAFDADAWFQWLQTVPAGPLFAVAPDVVGAHEPTVLRSGMWLPRIRDLGVPAAFVGQNGARPENMPWADFDVLFLGGSPECLPCGWVRPAHLLRVKRCAYCGQFLNEWKLSAAARMLTFEAKARGMWVHMGRVNSYKRLAYAASIGCDSADGTYLRFAPDTNLPKLEGWLRLLSEPHLFEEAPCG